MSRIAAPRFRAGNLSAAFGGIEKDPTADRRAKSCTQESGLSRRHRCPRSGISDARPGFCDRGGPSA